MKKQIKLPAARMEVCLEASTLDLEKRTIEMRWYTGATVQRMSFFDGPYELTFAMGAKNIRLGRLNAGAPLKSGHTGNSDLSAVLGVIERAWIENGEGRALARFSSRKEVMPILADVRDGILKNVSMEAAIYAIEDVTPKGVKEKSFLATDWEPMAVALVAVGADPAAQTLATSELFTCNMSLGADAPSTGKTIMTQVRLLSTQEIVEINEEDFDAKLHSLDLTGKAGANATRRAVDERIEADRKYAVEVKRLAAHFNLDEVWSQRHIKLGTPIDQVMADATEQRAKLAPQINGQISMGEDFESGRAKFEMMTGAIVARSKNQPVPEPSRQYARTSLVAMAHERASMHSSRARQLDPRYDQREVIELALTTSDFPNLLANAASKILLGDYESAPVTYRLLASRQDLPDFKTASVLKAGDFPVPLLVGESGEVKLGTFTEAKDTFALATYGRRLAFSFQSIVNDDLGAFGRVMGSYGRRLADFENALWFTGFISASGAGPTLGDTGALFNATAVTTAGGHANLTASGTAISVDSLGVGRAAMKKQVSLDGIKLNIGAKYLLTSPEKETLARQYTTVLGPNLAASSQNPWAGMLEPLSDANLVTANPWYLMADPSVAPVSVYGYLQGQSGPDVASRVGFEYLGVEIRVALHFGIGWIDFRGGYRNAGA